MKFYSQSDQDKWVLEILENKRNGFFVDVGAYDGIQTSNTYTLEKEFDWNGICVEANPEVFAKLLKGRSCMCVNMAVLDFKGECEFGSSEINQAPFNKIPCDTLNNILADNNCPSEIDYLSIDVEGCEYDIFKCFDFTQYEIKCMTVEHNLYLDGDYNKNRIFELLSNNGFDRVVEDAPCLDPCPAWYMKPYEDWYVNKKFIV
jgi:FkbM family methyltransferase